MMTSMAMDAFLPASLACCETELAPEARVGALALFAREDFVCHRPEPVLPPTDDDDEEEDEDDDRGSSGGNIDPDDDEGDFDDDEDDDDETLWTTATRVALTDGYR
jgi:hypothetical protein